MALAAHFSPTLPILTKPSTHPSSSFHTSHRHVNAGSLNNVIRRCIIMKVACRGGGGGDKGFEVVTLEKEKEKEKEKKEELELCVNIFIQQGLPQYDPCILSISKMLQSNAGDALKMALHHGRLKEHKTSRSINDVIMSGFQFQFQTTTLNLSLLLCNDEYITTLNNKDDATSNGVVSSSSSMSQHDIVISVETAANRAQERGHTLLDQIRILLVHGLLRLLGFHHQKDKMEKEEELLLKNLGWKGKEVIKCAYDDDAKNDSSSSLLMFPDSDTKKEGRLRFYRPNFKYIFSDMDGTLLNSKSQISLANANAIREAMSRGVQVIIATGKTRHGAIEVLKTVDLVGTDGNGIISESSPGVFVQGLLVYGLHGREIFTRNLDSNLCRKAFIYSLEHKIPLVAFAGDRCFTSFGHPRVDYLHSVYREPKAQIMSSAEELLASAQVQKLIFLDTPEGVETSLRPYWTEATTGNDASIVQALPDILELVPRGTSKGNGVKLLIDHLGIAPHEIMAIGDGENDIEMLKLAGCGVAVSNASDKAKAAANVIGVSNDEDGVADAIYRYAF